MFWNRAGPEVRRGRGRRQPEPRRARGEAGSAAEHAAACLAAPRVLGEGEGIFGAEDRDETSWFYFSR